MTVSARNISGRDLVVPLPDGSTVPVLAGNSFGFPDAVGNGLLLQTTTWQPGGAATPVTLTVALQGQTNMTVRVTGATLYTSVAYSTPVTFPQTISSDTTWYTQVYGIVTLTVSVKDSLGYEHITSGTVNLDPGSPATTVTVPLPPGGGGGAAPTTLTINSQAGTTYTFVLGDGNGATLVEFTNAAAVVATIPPHSSVAFSVGTVLLVSQQGSGQVAVTAGAGVTLRVPNGAKTAQQYSQVSVVQRATDEWIVSGDSST